MLLEILLAAFLVMLASLAGVLFVGRVAQQFLHDRLSYLVAFSAGVFLVTSGALALEVFEIYETAIWMGVLLILVGYGLAALLDTLLPEAHHHHDPDCQHGHGRGARKLIVGDAIHNIGDGIILVPAFMVSPALGMAVTVSIFIHEVLQEISEFFVLKQAGYSTKRALAINFSISSTIFIGVGLSYLALAAHDLEGVLLAVSAGFFLHVVIHDLLPRRSQHETVTTFGKHLLVVALGLCLMASVSYALRESHRHADSHDSDHHEEASVIFKDEAVLEADEADHHSTTSALATAVPQAAASVVSTAPEWRAWFPVTVPMRIGGVAVEASVADTEAARMQGLSGTPFIPDGVVKLFVFDTASLYTFWMKEMNYSIDIMWVDEALQVVHIEPAVAPESYPVLFGPAVPARYVIEARAGFVDTYGIHLGTSIELP